MARKGELKRLSDEELERLAQQAREQRMSHTAAAKAAEAKAKAVNTLGLPVDQAAQQLAEAATEYEISHASRASVTGKEGAVRAEQRRRAARRTAALESLDAGTSGRHARRSKVFQASAAALRNQLNGFNSHEEPETKEKAHDNSNRRNGNKPTPRQRSEEEERALGHALSDLLTGVLADGAIPKQGVNEERARQIRQAMESAVAKMPLMSNGRRHNTATTERALKGKAIRVARAAQAETLSPDDERVWQDMLDARELATGRRDGPSRYTKHHTIGQISRAFKVSRSVK